MDINVPFLETTAVPCARLLLPAIRPDNKPGHHGPIRAGTADLIVVLLKGEDHRANPEAFGTSDTGSFAWIRDRDPFIPLEGRGKRILG
jgi:hypothetical protein